MVKKTCLQYIDIDTITLILLLNFRKNNNKKSKIKHKEFIIQYEEIEIYSNVSNKSTIGLVHVPPQNSGISAGSINSFNSVGIPELDAFDNNITLSCVLLSTNTFNTPQIARPYHGKGNIANRFKRSG